MSAEKKTVTDLLSRLLAGERENLSMYLAMLLERSSPLHNSEEHYRAVLPPSLADIKISPEIADDVVATLCLEISRNPDAAFIAAVSTTGAERVTKCVAEVLIDPPRPLTTQEYEQVLGVMRAYLPACLGRNQLFLSSQERARFIERLRELRHADQIIVKRDAAELLKQLDRL